MIGEMAVVAAFVHEIDVIVGEAAIVQPASFGNVEPAGIVKRRVGFALPVNVVGEFGGDIALFAQVALVSAEYRPAVVIDGVDTRVGGLEERYPVFIPGGVVAEAFDRHAVVIDSGRQGEGRRRRGATGNQGGQSRGIT